MKEGKSLSKIYRKYLEALLEGDSSTAESLVKKAIQNGMTMEEIFLKIISPAQIEIGDFWKDSKINIAQEHLASEISLQQMNILRNHFSPKVHLKYKVAVTTPEGERHYVGARMVADLFYLEGWNVDFLGPETPAEDLVALVQEREIRLVAFSLSSPALLRILEKNIRALQNATPAPGILVGGRESEHFLFLEKKYSSLAVVQNLQESIARAYQLIGVGSQNLEDYLKVLGKKIQGYRQERQWSQQELADKTGVDRTYISTMENGKQNISLGVVLKLANAFCCSVEEFISS